jgi:hypothetical protein
MPPPRITSTLVLCRSMLRAVLQDTLSLIPKLIFLTWISTIKLTSPEKTRYWEGFSIVKMSPQGFGPFGKAEYENMDQLFVDLMIFNLGRRNLVMGLFLDHDLERHPTLYCFTCKKSWDNSCLSLGGTSLPQSDACIPSTSYIFCLLGLAL